MERITGFGTEAKAKDWIETKPPNNSVINLVEAGQTVGKYPHRPSGAGMAQGQGGRDGVG
jgi:hypothetical protein